MGGWLLLHIYSLNRLRSHPKTLLLSPKPSLAHRLMRSKWYTFFFCWRNLCWNHCKCPHSVPEGKLIAKIKGVFGREGLNFSRDLCCPSLPSTP
jgi:hypothetical protein